MAAQGRLQQVPRGFMVALCIGLAAQILFWTQAQDVRIAWSGVNQAPSPALAEAIALGDPQFYFRAAGLGLQNMGDQAGAPAPLRQYNYQRLAGWFTLLSRLDPNSHYAPSLAAYYYGASRDPDQVRHIIGYLRELGVRHPQQHWRWLAYSVYLARYRVKDPVLALEMARQLAALPVEGIPVWTRQLPAFVLAEAGEKEAARDILEAILATSPDLPQAEQYFIRDYITTRLGFAPAQK